MKKQILTTSLLFAFIFLFLFVIYKLLNQPINFSEIIIVKSTDHLKWSADKKNILIEYSDLQCPACKSFNSILKDFEAANSPNFDLTKRITLVFRHFPLYQTHQNAFLPAYALEAAGKQNKEKFFEMLDLLFNNQESWSKSQNFQEEFIKYAKILNLNIDQFKLDFNSKEIQNKVQEDLRSGEKAGINATPTFFLNGKKLEIQSLDDFTQQLRKYVR